MPYQYLRRFLASVYQFSLFAVLCIALLWSACKKEDVRPDSLYKVVEVGDFELLQTSIDQLPYQGKDSVTFVDRDENRLTFQIRESFNPSTLTYTEYYNVDFSGDTVVYRWGSQNKKFYLSNDSLGLRFRIELFAKPFEIESENPEVADYLWIWFRYGDDQLDVVHVFQHYTDRRTATLSWQPDVPESIELFGREFEDVFETPFSSPKSYVRFSYELGIVSFTDLDNKLWVYEE